MIEAGKRPIFNQTQQEAFEAARFLYRVFNPRKEIKISTNYQATIPLDFAKKGNIRAFGDSGMLAYGTRDRYTGEYQPDALDRFAIQELQKMGVDGWMSYNRAAPGSTSKHLLEELQSEAVKQRMIATNKPDLLLLGWGGNDFTKFFTDQQTTNSLLQLVNNPLNHLDEIFPAASKFARIKLNSRMTYIQTLLEIANLSKMKKDKTGTPIAGIVAITPPNFAFAQKVIVFPPAGSNAKVFETPIKGKPIIEGVAKALAQSVYDEVRGALHFFNQCFPATSTALVSASGLEEHFDGTEHFNKDGQQALGKRSAKALTFKSYW